MSRLRAAIDVGVANKRPLSPAEAAEEAAEDVSFTISLEWELVGKDQQATTLPKNSDVFKVPMMVLFDLNPWERNKVIKMDGSYLIVHAAFLEQTHSNLHGTVYIFFSNSKMAEIKDAIPHVVEPIPDLRLPDIKDLDPPDNKDLEPPDIQPSVLYPNGYMLKNTE